MFQLQAGSLSRSQLRSGVGCYLGSYSRLRGFLGGIGVRDVDFHLAEPPAASVTAGIGDRRASDGSRTDSHITTE